jgi:hypothetical protein
MLPNLRQRAVIVLGCAAAAWCCLQMQPWLAPIGPGEGMVLRDVYGGLPAGIVALLGAVAPAVIIAGCVSAMGHPISGVFVVSIALVVLVSAGGGSRGFFYRHELPEAWRWLTVEALVLLLGLAGTLMGLHVLRPAMRRRLRGRGRVRLAGRRTRLTRLTASAALAGVIAAAVGGLLTHVLVRNTEVGQIVGGLVVAFFVAGLVGHVVAPSRYPAGVLGSPLVVATLAYLWMLGDDGATTESILAALYGGTLPGLVLPLPLHYASAGLLGATLGVGLAEVIERSRSAPRDGPTPVPPDSPDAKGLP